MASRRALTTLLAGAVLASAVASAATAAVRNSFMLNEANTVSGDNYLESNKFDTTLGRVQGNGQNWMEFIVVQGDELPGGGFAHTLDLRNWKIEWSYNKNDPTDPNKYGSGTIVFTNDPLWAAMPVGTMLTLNEWQKVYYEPGSDAAGGLDRAGGIAGLGILHGSTAAIVKDFSTDTKWNPMAGGGGANADWNVRVWAGERNPDASFKYFNFTGSVVKGDPNNPVSIGTDEAGLYALNNDNWQWTIKDAGGNVVQGPLGETGTGVTAISPISGLPTPSNWSINSQEIVRLEGFSGNPTQAAYLNSWQNDYQDGSSSSYDKPNIWSSGSGVQSLASLRSWLREGDVNLDGQVDGADLLAWQRGFGATTGATFTGPSWFQGDVNGDGAVDPLDLAAIKSRFGVPASVAAAAVPECGAGCLAAIASAAFAGRRGLAGRSRSNS